MYVYEYTLTRNNRLTTDWASRQKNIIKLINESHAPICHNHPKRRKYSINILGLLQNIIKIARLK